MAFPFAETFSAGDDSHPIVLQLSCQSFLIVTGMMSVLFFLMTIREKHIPQTTMKVNYDFRESNASQTLTLKM